ncbi:MAG: hypothetical protein LBM93_00165 [Oscillospiraceae bacterium]|jgi:hypothetical protein|nr:hypothetical protein [Oscillospiraceae bacterium]
MKRVLSIILSLSLILCNCGKVNEPIIKRDTIKTIPINYLGEGHEKIWGTTIEIKGVEDETTVSINNFKEAIPKDKYDKVNAWYWKNGIGRALTEKPIHLDEVDKVEFVRKKEEVNHSPTPTPSLTPSPSPETKFSKEVLEFGKNVSIVAAFAVVPFLLAVYASFSVLYSYSAIISLGTLLYMCPFDISSYLPFRYI